MIKILVVGQIPPPFGGQAIMIENLLRVSSPDLKMYHVRMDFSRNMNDIGKAQIRKLFHLGSLVFRICGTRIFTGSTVLYYPPAGPNRIPMYRDIVILLLTRWMFKKTVFHFHAGGLCELYASLSAPTRLIFRLAYFKPDVSIRISDLNPEDGKVVMSKRECVVPNGIEDAKEKFKGLEIHHSSPPKILFVGILCESKGLMDLINACSILLNRKALFNLEIIGKFESNEFEALAKRKILNLGLINHIHFLGIIFGNDKYKIYHQSDIFCFPTYFESETFGLVLLEAMCFGLPLVATEWRGIPSIVKDGENGFLLPIKNPTILADKLESLLLSPALRKSMGDRGREIFREKYKLGDFHSNMIRIFKSLYD